MSIREIKDSLVNQTLTKLIKRKKPNKLLQDEINKRITNFYKRFFSQQYKRSAMPDGPKVGSVALSPRGDWRMPSDACSDMFSSP